MKSNLDFHSVLSEFDFSDYSIAVVQSKYHSHITDSLYQGAIEVLKFYNVGSIYHLETAGAYELIYATSEVVYDDELAFDGVITLGCVIKGDTDHDVYINQAVTDSLARMTTDAFIPISLGLLTVNTEAQAIERSGGAQGNKGKEAALALLHSIAAEIKKV